MTTENGEEWAHLTNEWPRNEEAKEEERGKGLDENETEEKMG